LPALTVSLDGFIEGPNGELDWAMAEDDEAWRELFDALTHVDTFILGRRMYPAYEQYWLAVLANPAGILPFSGRAASRNETAYARLADRMPHLVVSTTLDTVAWKTTRIVRDVDEIRRRTLAATRRDDGGPAASPG
jgi:dihydrofolate reductase